MVRSITNLIDLDKNTSTLLSYLKEVIPILEEENLLIFCCFQGGYTNVTLKAYGLIRTIKMHYLLSNYYIKRTLDSL